jgi:transposase
LELPAESRALIESDLRLLEAVERELNALVGELARHAHADDRARLLMTLPGIDYVSAVGLLAALGDLDRFPDPDKLAAYLGLVPSTRQSGEKCYHGPITKHGNSNARWLLIQAAQHLRTHPGPLGVCYRKLRQKKNHNVAVVACARKMARIIWFMLKNNEPYRYAQPRLTDDKLARLRIQVTGQKKKTGPKKGAGVAPNQGTGRRTRTIPALSQVYAEAGLPPAKALAQLPPGELHALERQGVTDYVAAIQAAQKVPRRQQPAPDPPKEPNSP